MINKGNIVNVILIVKTIIREDTVEFRPQAYKLRENETAYELIKQLDSVKTNPDGIFVCQDQPIAKTKVNDKLYEGSALDVLRKLPAKSLNKVMIIDDYSDAAMQSFKDMGPKKILTIITKGYIEKTVVIIDSKLPPAKTLNEVKINGTPRVIYKADTVEYRASDYKVRSNNTTDELLKHIQGMEVGPDGSITYQGQN